MRKRGAGIGIRRLTEWALGPLSQDDKITVDITAVGTTNPGRRLVVSIRL